MRVGTATLVLFYAGCSSVAHATDWQIATFGTNKSVWFVDKDSIRDVPDGYNQSARKVWIKTDYSSVKTEEARETKQLAFIKCAEEQVKVVSVVRYRADGSVLSSYTPPYTSYEAIVPDSVMSGVMRAVCSQNAVP